MGQKVNPNSFRVGINTSWLSSWYGDKKDYAKKKIEFVLFRKDEKLSDYLTEDEFNQIMKHDIIGVHFTNTSSF